MKAWLQIETFNGKTYYSICHYEKTRDDKQKKLTRILIDNDEMTGFRFQSIETVVSLMKGAASDNTKDSSLRLRNRPVQIQPGATPIPVGIL